MKSPLKLFLLLLLIFHSSCNNHKPERIVFKKDIGIDWNKANAHNFDIKYIQLNFDPFLNKETMGKGIDELVFKDSVYTLDSIDCKRLKAIISDSSSFTNGECGTFALNAGFIFTKNDTIKGIVELGCGYSQWVFDPFNENARGGSVSDVGYNRMTVLLDDINKKMKK